MWVCEKITCVKHMIDYLFVAIRLNLLIKGLSGHDCTKLRNFNISEHRIFEHNEPFLVMTKFERKSYTFDLYLFKQIHKNQS